jgi:YVTN family beta-propeller protein
LPLKIVKKIGFAINGVEKELIQPVGIAYSKKGLVFVALGSSNRLAVIDAKTLKVIKYILVGQRVWQLAFNNDESKWFYQHHFYPIKK